MFEFFAVGNVIEIFIGDEEDLLSGVRGVSSAVHENTLFMSTLLSGVYRIEINLEGVLEPDEFDLIDEWTLRLPKGELAAFTSGVKRLGSLTPGVYRALRGRVTKTGSNTTYTAVSPSMMKLTIAATDIAATDQHAPSASPHPPRPRPPRLPSRTRDDRCRRGRRRNQLGCH